MRTLIALVLFSFSLFGQNLTVTSVEVRPWLIPELAKVLTPLDIKILFVHIMSEDPTIDYFEVEIVLENGVVITNRVKRSTIGWTTVVLRIPLDVKVISRKATGLRLIRSTEF